MNALLCTILLGVVAMTVGQQLLRLQPDPTDCTRFRINHDYFKNFPPISCSNGLVFSARMSTCVSPADPANDQCPQVSRAEDVARLCGLCPTCVYPNPTKCAKFYNCSRTARDFSDVLPPLEDECIYPQQFDVVTGKCVHFSQNICGTRQEAKYQCEYDRNAICRTGHCRPCSVDYADCRGLPNGAQPWPERAWTPYYTICQNGRTMQSTYCTTARDGKPRIFSAETKACEELSNIPRAFGGLL